MKFASSRHSRAVIAMLVAMSATTTSTLSLATVIVEPVVVTGRKPYSSAAICDSDGVCVFDDRPPGVGDSPTGAGGGSQDKATAKALEKFSDVISKAKDGCQKADESQEEWLIRQLQNWLETRPGDGIAIYQVRLALTPAAAQGSMSPPPPKC